MRNERILEDKDRDSHWDLLHESRVCGLQLHERYSCIDLDVKNRMINA